MKPETEEDERAPQESLAATNPSNADPLPASPPSRQQTGNHERTLSSSSHKTTQLPPKSHTLLGSDELSKHLEDRQAVFQITSFNMGSLPLPDEQQLRKIFYHYQHATSTASSGAILEQVHVDVHVVAIQECWPDTDALELQMQMCLCPEFALFHSVSFGTLHMSVFLRRDLLWFTTGNLPTRST